MDYKKYYYLKIKENFYDDDAMIVLQNMQDGYMYSDILLKMYLRSLKNNGKLVIGNGEGNFIPYTSKMLADVLHHQVGTVEKAVQIFRNLGLVDILDDGAMYMLNIQNFIGSSSTEADRIRDYRNRIANEKTYKIEPPKVEKEIKHKYGQYKNVLLSDEQLEKLKNEFSSDWKERIENVSCYCASTGKTYRDYLATIRNWSKKDKFNKKEVDYLPTYDISRNVKMSKDEEDELLKLMGKK